VWGGRVGANNQYQIHLPTLWGGRVGANNQYQIHLPTLWGGRPGPRSGPGRVGANKLD